MNLGPCIQQARLQPKGIAEPIAWLTSICIEIMAAVRWGLQSELALERQYKACRKLDGEDVEHVTHWPRCLIPHPVQSRPNHGEVLQGGPLLPLRWVSGQPKWEHNLQRGKGSTLCQSLGQG